MAILPNDPFALQGAVATENEPGRTWYIDKFSGRIMGEVDEYAAVRQAIEIILNAERFAWQIYSPSSGVEYRNLIGQEAGYVAMELQRRIAEALTMDSRVLGIDGYTFSLSGDRLSINFIVRTVYGPVEEDMEFSL